MVLISNRSLSYILIDFLKKGDMLFDFYFIIFQKKRSNKKKIIKNELQY